MWQNLLDGEQLLSPFGSLNFLQNRDQLLSQRFSGQDVNTAGILNAMQAVVTHLIRATHKRLTQLRDAGKSDFEARNETQFFYGRDLAVAFIQTTVLERFLKHVQEDEGYDLHEKAVLGDLGLLFGLVCLEKNMPHLVKFGIVSSPDSIGSLQSQFVNVSNRIKPNAVALADVLAPTDFVLNSVLGHSRDQHYKTSLCLH